MKIAMANDHAGTVLKNAIKAYLEAEGHEVQILERTTRRAATCRISSIRRRSRSRRANATAACSSTASAMAAR